MADENLTTRERILYLLRRKGPQTAQELSHVLDISVNAVRQHTSCLQGAGLIESQDRRQKKGRPGHEYVLRPKSEDAFPKGYKDMAMSLLDAAKAIGGDELVHKLVLHRRNQVFEEYARAIRGLPLQEKLARIAQGQDERGYLAHVEQIDDVQALIQCNCPIQELSQCFPEFCESERKMYEELLGREVELEQCRAQGAQCCRFTTNPDCSTPAC
jgi:predicted ArsR family transcriptional regulator